MANNDYDEVNRWKELVKGQLEKRPIIDDNFFEEYFSRVAQARFISKECDDVHDAMIMNGLAGIDCSRVDFSRLSYKNYTKITFDSSTKFPEDVKEIFSKILEKGKEFGCGLKELEDEGILSGEGIHLAVIDQDFDTEKLKDVDIMSHKSTNPPGDHFHGKTVTSLLASKSCGVAKGAKVHFFGTHSKDREESLEEIIEYNKNCKNEEDKILVLSGSWSIKNPEKFKQWQCKLRETGCELVCQNNFIENFTEISGNDVILEFSDEEKKLIPDKMKEMLNVIDLNSAVRIPINRTYNQFETLDSTSERADDNFKYQASFSNSWGIPQVAGLFALYRAKDKTLTFDDFCLISKRTANKRGIINPKGINEVVERKIAEQQNSLLSNILSQDDDVR